MPAFNFQRRFAADVRSGKKDQTIRSTKRGNVGDPAYLYTGQRTKQCEKLGQSTLTLVFNVHIHENTVFLFDGTCILDRDALDKFAKADGFSSFAEMTAWFQATHGLPFSGCLGHEEV